MFFSALFAQVDEFRLDLAAHLIVGRSGNRDAARIGDAFQSGGDIDAVSEDVVAIHHDVPEVDADTVNETPVFLDALIALGHHPLDLERAFDQRRLRRGTRRKLRRPSS